MAERSTTGPAAQTGEPDRPAGAAMSVARLEREIAGCRACAAEFAATRTAHAPRPVTRLSTRARILIAGQAPGARVHGSGLPFDDPSGDRLRAWMGIGREVFYDRRRIAILPMAFCFPGYDARGADLPPPGRCAEIWRARALAAMAQVELTLLVGGYAQKWALAAEAGPATVTATVRDWRRLAARGMLPTPHPSWRNAGWLKRNPWFEEETIPWLQDAVSRLAR